jgi:steroid 5-alpha reductase family enzyme
MVLSLITLLFNSYQLLYSAVALNALFIITWIISIFKQDVSIDQHIWGLGFAIQSLIYYLESPQLTWQKTIFTFLVLFHTLRLTTYIFIREYKQPEDRRYQLLLRDRFGNQLSYLSLFIVFIPQMIFNWIVGLSLFSFEVSKNVDKISNLTFLFGCFIMMMGTFIESLADIQLYFFKQDKRNEGKIMERGLWRYSRHPNYFGEVMFWWGVFVANLSLGIRVVIFAPLIMHLITRFFIGIPMTEKLMEKDFGAKMEQYQQKTSAFTPGPTTETNISQTNEMKTQ